MLSRRAPPHPLLTAASAGDLDATRREMERLGPGPLSRAAQDGVDPLMLACANGREDVVALLARFGGFGVDRMGRNPLHYAARYARPICMRLLVALPEASGWSRASDEQGKTPLTDALEADSVPCARLLIPLIDLGSSPEIGRSAILSAAAYGSWRATLWLSRKLPALATPSEAFSAACGSQESECIEAFGSELAALPTGERARLASSGLLAHCSIPFASFFGFDAWIVERLRSKDELCARALLALGADPAARDAEGNAPLALAAANNRVGAAPLLFGISPSQLAPGRRSASRIARQRLHIPLANELARAESSQRQARSLARACAPTASRASSRL